MEVSIYLNPVCIILYTIVCIVLYTNINSVDFILGLQGHKSYVFG